MLLQVSGSPAVLACLSSWIQRRQGPFVLAVGRVGLTEVRWQQQQQDLAVVLLVCHCCPAVHSSCRKLRFG